MGWMDIMSKRNKSELKENKLVNGAKKELKQLRDKHLNSDCISLDVHELREDCINRLKVAKSNAKRDLDELCRREWN